MEGLAARLLGPDGPLAQSLPGYEVRSGQLDMAAAVERAFAAEHVLVCEAGTGIGKTLAYLVPAILSGRKVVVSTATKALEEQIFEKDIPLVARHLGLDANAALVKGLGNYLCLRRFGALRATAVPGTDAHRALPMVEAWAAETKGGDVSELVALSERDPIWPEIASSSDTRIGASCAFYERCFVTKMKRASQASRIVVVNHHLFFADLALRRSVARRGAQAYAGVGALPPYDAVVFDEAHQLEDIAALFLGTRLSRARLDAFARDAHRSFELARVAHGSITDVARNASDRFFAALVGRASPEERGASARFEAGEGRQMLARDAWSGALLDAYLDLDTALDVVERFAEANGVSEEVRQIADRAATLRADAARIVEPATHHASWVEVRGRSVVVGATPTDVGGVLRNEVFERVGTAVLTSATLAAGSHDKFEFVRSRMGLVDASVPVMELAVPSPFDFERRALVYLPRDLPDVRDARFVARAAERIRDLVALTGGGAFVLCTSTRGMRAISADLMRDRERLVLVQGDAPKRALVERFRADGNAVLVATMSFWEGVDVPGDALRLVVIDKLPFAVPTDPLVAARSAALEAEGHDPFTRYAVPQAALLLKQGFGRLIRSRRDGGIVAILDRRLSTRGYGKTLLESLPPARRVERFEDVRAFWDDLRAPAPAGS